ncbi:MAG TPA: WD40 repeat domain-containing protein [Pirellulales bacterium]
MALGLLLWPATTFAQQMAVAPRKLVELPTPPVTPGRLFLKEDAERVVTFSPDGRFVAVSTLDAGASFAAWETSSGKLVGQGPESGWTFLPDQQTIFAQCLDDTFTVKLGVRHDLVASTHRIVGRYKRSQFEFGRMLLSPDGQWVAAVLQTPKKPSRIALLPDGKPEKPLVLAEGEANQFAFSSDGRWLAARTPNGIRLFDVNAKSEHKFAAAGAEPTLAFSDTGRTLATADLAAATGELFDVPSGESRQKLDLKVGHDAPVSAVAFSPVSTLFATGDADGFVVLKDAASGERIARFSAQSSRVSALGFSPDGRSLLVLADGDRETIGRLWSIGEAKPAAPRQKPRREKSSPVPRARTSQN